MSLYEYVMLGRSGLRVSPLCLGAMTFGTEWGFGKRKACDLSVATIDDRRKLEQEGCGNSGSVGANTENHRCQQPNRGRHNCNGIW